LAFISDRGGNADIYVLDLANNQLTNLSNHAATDEYPAWSPDGAKIAFSSDRSGAREIYVMDANGANVTMVTNDGYDNWKPAWRP
jgi:Tol biopolymer transport system component